MNKFIRVAIEVEAMQVNIPYIAVADWCGGTLYSEGPSYQGINVIINNKIVIAKKEEWIVKFSKHHFCIMDDETFKLEFTEI